MSIRKLCFSIGCHNFINMDEDFCSTCALTRVHKARGAPQAEFLDPSFNPPVKLNVPKPKVESMSSRYPKYYKSVAGLEEVDVYAVHMLFQVDDPSGAIQHASKKLLLSGCRTGGKSAFDDIREARDTLNRWLELNAPDKAVG